MDTLSVIIGVGLLAVLGAFIMRLIYVIASNLVNGRKFHQSLEHEFNRLRLSRMLTSLGINKTEYIHNTPVVDIKHHMDSCNACENIDECDTKLSTGDIDVDAIDFCKNEASLKKIKEQNQKQEQSDPAAPEGADPEKSEK